MMRQVKEEKISIDPFGGEFYRKTEKVCSPFSGKLFF